MELLLCFFSFGFMFGVFFSDHITPPDIPFQGNSGRVQISMDMVLSVSTTHFTIVVIY